MEYPGLSQDYPRDGHVIPGISQAEARDNLVMRSLGLGGRWRANAARKDAGRFLFVALVGYWTVERGIRFANLGP